MFNSILNSTQGSLSIQSELICILTSLILGLVIGHTYGNTKK